MYNDYKRPNVGELSLQAYLENCGFQVKKTGKTEQKYYDFIAQKDDRSMTFEAKYDNYCGRSYSIFIEDHHILIGGERNRELMEGWIWETRADYLSYYAPDKHYLYIIRMKELQDYVKENKEHLQKKNTSKDGYKITYGFLVDLDKYRKSGNVLCRYEIPQSEIDRVAEKNGIITYW